MRRSWTAERALLLIAALCAGGILGCAPIRNSGIDPSGEHVFAAPPLPPQQPCPTAPGEPLQPPTAPIGSAQCLGQPAPPAQGAAVATPNGIPVDVRIVGPQQATVGEVARFDVNVTNRGSAVAKGLTIKDRLDPGLVHAQSGESGVIEQRNLRDLAPGESIGLKLILRVTQPGRLCQTVEVAGSGVSPASAQACITALPPGGHAASGLPTPVPTPEPPAAPPISIKVSGPAHQAVGEQARFAIEISNTGSAPLRGLKLVDRWDAAIMPTLATDGFYNEQGALAWKIDELAPGASTRRDIHFACQAASPKVCNRARVILADGNTADGEACLEVHPAPAAPAPTPPVHPTPSPPVGQGLTVSVVGLRNPVAVGNELTYEIRVTNTGTAAAQQVAVTATVPDGMTPSALGTTGSTKYAVDEQTVRFEPAAELRPGDSLVDRVRVRTKQPGQFRFRAEIAVPGMSSPLVKEASTEVFK
ncbi:MAG: DUF11 domain-containing protein [Planctomycetaceae bacterium]|nr:DUF11 domain-containing protein [Planctomycetaceae bacterium]